MPRQIRRLSSDFLDKFCFELTIGCTGPCSEPNREPVLPCCHELERDLVGAGILASLRRVMSGSRRQKICLQTDFLFPPWQAVSPALLRRCFLVPAVELHARQGACGGGKVGKVMPSRSLPPKKAPRSRSSASSCRDFENALGVDNSSGPITRERSCVHIRRLS